MGLFATIAGKDTCPKCGSRADWQSKGLWLKYKKMDIWIGEYNNVELDENMNGYVVAFCFGRPSVTSHKGCGARTYYKIVKGKLIESTEDNYMNTNI
mgnify:FL=1